MVVRDRSGKEGPKNLKANAEYCPLDVALQYRWTGLSKRQTKEVQPATLFAILGMSLVKYTSFAFICITFLFIDISHLLPLFNNDKLYSCLFDFRD